MKILIKPPALDPPYSLHDACITEMRVERDALRLVTQYGYVCTAEPYGQVEGDVEITEIDQAYSCVYVMEYHNVLCGNYGAFSGRKLTLETFLREFPQVTLDIMDETYGYQQIKLNGFLHEGERCLEFFLDLCYTGEFRYLLKD